MHTSYRMMQTDVMWSDADELVFVRWGVCIWGGGSYSSESYFSVWVSLDELRLPLFTWSCWIRRREEKSLWQTELRDMGSDSERAPALRWLHFWPALTYFIHVLLRNIWPHLYFSSAESGAGLSLLCASVLLGLPSSTLSQVCLLHVLEKQIRRVLMLYAFISDAGKKYGVRFFRVVLMNRFAAESVRESTQRVGACGASWRDEIMVFMRTNKS